MPILNKDISPYPCGNSISITYSGTETAPDLTTIVDHNGDSPTSYEFNQIITVNNSTGASVTLYGEPFGNGTTNLQQQGSIQITPVSAGGTLEGASGVTVTLVGQIQWGSDHSSYLGT